MLLIAWPSSLATESTTIFPHACPAGDSGIVFVTIILSIGDFSMRSMAAPESTPCTAHAITRAAPFAFNAPARMPSVSMPGLPSSTNGGRTMGRRR